MSACAVEPGGLARAVAMMSLGNEIGFDGNDGVDWAVGRPGAIVAELTECCGFGRRIGTTTSERTVLGESIGDLAAAWEGTLADVFPIEEPCTGSLWPPAESDRALSAGALSVPPRHSTIAHPRVLIPVFPGTTGEYDACRAVERAGGAADTVLIRALTPVMLEESRRAFEAALRQTQMLILPGTWLPGAGFAFLSDPRMKEAVQELLSFRDGLILGLGGGFGTLMRLGMLPGVLSANPIGRHVSRYAGTTVCGASPWLSLCRPGTVYTLPVCTGQGQYTCADIASVRVASRYVHGGPAGSDHEIEGVCSPDGRVLGKLGHCERWSPGGAVNVPGVKFQPIFEGGIAYFK